MTLLLVFIAIAVAGTTTVLALGRLRGPKMRSGTRGSGTRAVPYRWERGGASEIDAMSEPLANVPPVLLPDHAEPSDIAALRFSVAFRGYRMDQVDAVLESLASDLRQRNELLADLQQRNELLAELQQGDGKAGGH